MAVSAVLRLTLSLYTTYTTKMATYTPTHRLSKKFVVAENAKNF